MQSIDDKLKSIEDEKEIKSEKEIIKIKKIR